MAPRSKPLVRSTLIGLFAVALAAAAEAPTRGLLRLDGKPIEFHHAYLFRAPDQWEEKQTNAVVVVTPQPIAKAAIDGAKTLADVYALVAPGVVLEIGPDKRAHMTVHHPGFGDLSYSTSPFTSDFTAFEPGHVAGHIGSFSEEDETIFGKYKIWYGFDFDAAPLQKEFKARH